ncbi:hypothetical protein [Mycobacterium sp. E2479]|uniref:hypothetical protein n=1 Tax=Mycobacterium sp. E2479 TaxID=1834134 RepID=UPI0007FE6192|nr:hypothetical protein A5686_19295 [Mycobacterium sp. E2479]
MGFGQGPRMCIGSGPARLKAKVALNCLFGRVKRIERARKYTWTANPSLLGPTRLPMRGVAA